jgi:outer membrane protein
MQIRNIVKLTVVIGLMLILGSRTGFCADVAKIGVVSFQKILENSEAGKAAKKELTTEGQAMEADLKKKSDEISELQQMLQRDTGIMTKEARDEKQWELTRKIDDVKALKKKYDRKIQELQAQLLSGIRQDLVTLIREYGQKQGYLMIIEDIGVVYAPQSIEISDAIIKLYNEQYSQQGDKTQGPKG